MWLRTLKSEAFIACTCYNMHIPDTWSWFGALYHVLNKQAVNLHQAYWVCGHKLQAFALSHLSILLFGAIFSLNFVLFKFFIFLFFLSFHLSILKCFSSEIWNMRVRKKATAGMWRVQCGLCLWQACVSGIYCFTWWDPFLEHLLLSGRTRFAFRWCDVIYHRLSSLCLRTAGTVTCACLTLQDYFGLCWNFIVSPSQAKGKLALWKWEKKK